MYVHIYIYIYRVEGRGGHEADVRARALVARVIPSFRIEGVRGPDSDHLHGR